MRYEICLYVCECCMNLNIVLPGYAKVGVLHIIVALYNVLI